MSSTKPPIDRASRRQQNYLNSKSSITKKDLYGNKFTLRCISHKMVRKNGRTFQVFLLLVDTNLFQFYSGEGKTAKMIERTLEDVRSLHQKLATSKTKIDLLSLPKKKSKLSKLFNRSQTAQKEELDKQRQQLDLYFQHLSQNMKWNDDDDNDNNDDNDDNDEDKNIDIVNFFSLSYSELYMNMKQLEKKRKQAVHQKKGSDDDVKYTKGSRRFSATAAIPNGLQRSDSSKKLITTRGHNKRERYGKYKSE